MLDELEHAARRQRQLVERCVLGALLCLAGAATGDQKIERTALDEEPLLYVGDPCVIVQTPEDECRRFRLVEHADGTTYRIRVRLTHEQREEAEAWWNRPENRWRR